MSPQKVLPDRTTPAISRQIAAMAADVFEIGVFDARPEASRMLLRVWEPESLRRSIQWLRHENRDGRNIYVRPAGEHNLSLVDDLKHQQVEAMKNAGFEPALVVETSPGNHQAWLKHPQKLSHEASTAAARMLAEKFGADRGSADWRHFGRLAGFTNRKPKYQDPETGLYPFVKVIESSGAEYSSGQKFIGEVREYVEQETRRNLELRSRYEKRNGLQPEFPVKTIDHFRQDPRYASDQTRADMAYAVYALSHGVSEIDVSNALRTRNLSHKGNDKRQFEYVERTIQKAVARGVGR